MNFGPESMSRGKICVFHRFVLFLGGEYGACVETFRIDTGMRVKL